MGESRSQSFVFSPETMAKRTTILFMTNAELGQSSIILAVAGELAGDDTLDVHIASFAGLASLVPAETTFHSLHGRSMKESLAQRGIDFLPRHPPGVQGAIQSYRELVPALLAPWDPNQYFAIYDHCISLAKDLHPHIIILDPLLGPGIDACKTLHQRHVILSPGTFKDHVLNIQPRLEVLWKYPVYVWNPHIVKLFYLTISAAPPRAFRSPYRSLLLSPIST